MQSVFVAVVGALKNIYYTARDPNELRFIVLMRDPIMRFAALLLPLAMSHMYM